MVTTSPSVETVGATRLSRSHSRRTAPIDSTTVAASTTRLAIRPPTIEMSTRSRTRIVSATPKAIETNLAINARTNDSTTVSDSDASTFWVSTDSRLADSRNVPVWIAVEMRLPTAPKMLPRSPIAAGTITSSPGSSSNVVTIAPRSAPATRLVDELNTSATRLWRAASPVGPSRSTRRRPSSRGRGRCRLRRRAMGHVVGSRRPGPPGGPGHPIGQGRRREDRLGGSCPTAVARVLARRGSVCSMRSRSRRADVVEQLAGAGGVVGQVVQLVRVLVQVEVQRRQIAAELDVLAVAGPQHRDGALVLSEAEDLLDDRRARVAEVELVVHRVAPVRRSAEPLQVLVQERPQRRAVAEVGRGRAHQVEQRRGDVDVLGEARRRPGRVGRPCRASG